MKNIFKFVIVIMMMLLCTACTNTKDDSIQTPIEKDAYVGKYVSIGELNGELEIRKEEDTYYVYIDFYDLVEMIGVGKEKNGTIFYDVIDEYGNELYGSIEEYGEDLPIRVEFYIDETFVDEIEFERKK